MTLEDTIKQYKDWAEEWELLANLVKEDEEAGHKCQFSEGSEAYFKDAKQARQIAYWLEELKVYKKALQEACQELSFRDCERCYEYYKKCGKYKYIDKQCFKDTTNDYLKEFINQARTEE